MKTDKPITSMARLRKEKRRLEQRIEMEKADIFQAAEDYKNSLWPFRLLNKFKKTVDVVSDNKLLVLGAEIAYAALDAVKNKRKSEDGTQKSETGSGKKEKGDEKDESSQGNKVVNFLKEVAKSFIDLQKNRDGSKKDDK